VTDGGPSSDIRGKKGEGAATTIIAWTVSLALMGAAAGLTAWVIHSAGGWISEAERKLAAAEPKVIDMGGPPPSSSEGKPGEQRVVEYVATVPAKGSPPTEGDDQRLIQVLSNPDWVSPPRPVFPQKAADAGVEEGLVAMICTAKADGSVAECVIYQETPAGYEFGEAAYAAVRQARVRPRRVDGKAIDSKVSYRTRFRVQ
jgi:protein TonB